jgi:hypothetical protein
MIHAYRESVLSHLYPGFQHSANCLEPAVLTFEDRLSLPVKYRAKVLWRIDQGFGGDENINWLLERGYGVLAKGCSNRRSANLVHQVQRWRAVSDDKFIGRVPTPDGFVKPIDTFSIRYATSTGWKHAYLLSTLGLPGVATAHLYDQRGGAETEFRSDKSGGLHMDKRRKHKRDAQEAWLVLTDMAHNCLTWLARLAFANSPFESFGFLRISRDLLRIPGSIEMKNGQLLSVKLLKTSPYAAALLDCLGRFWQ